MEFRSCAHSQSLMDCLKERKGGLADDCLALNATPRTSPWRASTGRANRSVESVYSGRREIKDGKYCVGRKFRIRREAEQSLPRPKVCQGVCEAVTSLVHSRSPTKIVPVFSAIASKSLYDFFIFSLSGFYLAASFSTAAFKGNGTLNQNPTLLSFATKPMSFFLLDA